MWNWHYYVKYSFTYNLNVKNIPHNTVSPTVLWVRTMLCFILDTGQNIQIKYSSIHSPDSHRPLASHNFIGYTLLCFTQGFHTLKSPRSMMVIKLPINVVNSLPQELGQLSPTNVLRKLSQSFTTQTILLSQNKCFIPCKFTLDYWIDQIYHMYILSTLFPRGKYFHFLHSESNPWLCWLSPTQLYPRPRSRSFVLKSHLVHGRILTCLF